MKNKAILCSFFGVLIMVFTSSFCSGFRTKLTYKENIILHKTQKLIKEKNFDSAIKILKNFIQKRTNPNYLLFFVLGNCYFDKGNKKLAIINYKRCLDINSEYLLAWVNLAKAYFDTKDYRKAADSFLEAYKVSNPKNPDLLFYSALSLFYAKDFTKAELTIKKLLTDHKSHQKLEWKKTLIHIYLAENRPRLALPLVEEMSEICPEKEKKKWQQMRLYLYLTLSMKKKAFSYLTLLLKQYPLEPKWWKGLAHFYLEENNYKSALVALIIKSFIKPLNEQETNLIAELFFAINVPDKAIEYYKRLLTLKHNKTSTKFLKSIGLCYLKMFEPEKALYWINMALEKKSAYTLLMLKGEILYELGRYQEAANCFYAASKTKSKPSEALLMAAYSWINANDLNAAKKILKKLAKTKKYKLTVQKLLTQLSIQ